METTSMVGTSFFLFLFLFLFYFRYFMILSFTFSYRYNNLILCFLYLLIVIVFVQWFECWNGIIHTHRVVDTVYFLPLICMSDPQKIQKCYFSPYGATRTSRTTWRNLFGHWSTQSAFFSQNNQNCPSQPWL